MQVRYGNFLFPADALSWVHDFETAVSPGGVHYEEEHFVDLQGEVVIDTGQKDIADYLSKVENQLRVPNLDLTLYRNDGGVAMSLPAGGSFGVHLRHYNYPVGDGGFEWVSGRTFRCKFTAKYPLNANRDVYLRYKERLSFQGDGRPVIGLALPVNAPAIVQTLSQFSGCVCVQEGFALGLRRPPPRNPPLFNAPMMPADYTLESAEADGLDRKGYLTTWSYRFLTPAPLNGLPRAWPLGL